MIKDSLKPIPSPYSFLSPLLCRIQKLNQILRSDFLLVLLLHQGGCLLGFTPVSIHTQFRSSFSLTMVTSRHLSIFSLQTPPSKKMPLLLWLCFAQTPMPSIATVNNVLFVAAFKSIRSIPYLLNDCVQFEENVTEWISESQLAEYSSLFIEHDNNVEL